ncbi:alpha-protein kinase 1 [Spea bombifrons]|uniref:alpha-protein kinase 1 n=1 Tax=Spea bombifrons TaxID=233779 RepID=UPI0023495F61|nr:alpha-protein kinase 1 [Spea bombifrons]
MTTNEVIDHSAPRDTRFTVKWETVIMNNQEVVALLDECKQKIVALASEVSQPSEEEKNDYQRCRASLPDDLKTLIEEAKEMKWPFVPERWQYKQAMAAEDKTNLQDLINPRLHDLLFFLKASITVADSATAAAIVFLVDRFLYWADASTRLLSVAKALHKMWPATPIAPQVVIRQARISTNSGKLLKAEYILSSLIINNGRTGSWSYSDENDRVLVQSVCIQIRGQILQKLGMWYEAAELIWASIVGFSELPIPDKKGIATSLGVLADIFISMSAEDYQRFKNRSHVCLSLLEEFDHRLLSAAEASKLAAAFSLYTPLFVLTNLNIRGTCLLSYSLSKDCLMEKKPLYLSEAKESFEIGLLTKKSGDLVTSKQELHSFVKAAFCLANIHTWLQMDSVPAKDVSLLCSEAMEKLAKYSMLTDKQDKGNLANDIMSLVGSVKECLQVQPFATSDDHSYVPDSYRDCAKKTILTGNVKFSKVLEMFSQHHRSVCEAFESSCRSHKATDVEPGACVTALKTHTISTAEDSSCPTTGGSDLSSGTHGRRRKLVRSNALTHSLDGTNRKSLGKMQESGNSTSSSWYNVSNSSSSWESLNVTNDSELVIEESELAKEDSEETDKMNNTSAITKSDSGSGQNKDEQDLPIQDLSVHEGEEGVNQNSPSPLVRSESDASRSLLGNMPDVYGQTAEYYEIVDRCAETESATDCISYPPDVTDDIGRHEGSFTESPVSFTNQDKDRYQNPDLLTGSDFNVIKQQRSVDSSSSKKSLWLQNTASSLDSGADPLSVLPADADFLCVTTEEEEDKLNSSYGSSSWAMSAQFSGSISESVSSRGSFALIRKQPSLDATDCEKLLSGVDSDWILERLGGTERLKALPREKTYNAMLLKFSKKSELWTAQETCVYFGKYVKVTKEGHQRNAFWVHCLHQDETLGRYIGKEYKEQRNILHHFKDVERQMTAQYYVNEFNKRLYEMNIPTQLFYIPSSLLLILEDGIIEGCVTMEPYVLGEFVKLSNNKEIVKMQYEATKYGLALGHFAYEFSGRSDIVVDLQGWVTGSKKGEALIYLTDPQFHSVKNTSLEASRRRGANCTNFGKRGIELFFTTQHGECNEICHSLSLTRPNLAELYKQTGDAI